MKRKNFLFYSAILIGGFLNAQEDQTAKATKMGDGPFMSYVINESGGEYTYAGINKEVWTFTFKPYQADFKEIEIKEADKTSTDNYYPDEEAFPVTYVWGRLNTEACMKGWDYLELRKENRMVILDEWIYILEKWESKDSYRIKKCLKKGQLSGFGLTKKAFGAAKEMEKANHKETLQKYLDEAFKKQSELLPAWQANNKAKIDKRIAAKERYQFTIDSVNGKYWSSAEGQRVLAANKAKESKNSSNSASNSSKSGSFSGNIYFHFNMMGKDRPGERLYIHSGSNAAYVTSTTPGSDAAVKCEKGNAYYSFTGKKADMKLIKELTPEDCGKKFNYTDFK
jgi:hypothetical protein